MLAVGVWLGTGASQAQVTLQADGPGNTYELLSSVLGGSPQEVPDCGHGAFGRHITEAWDATLGKYVFVFHIHVTPDNDRCVNFDRQRNEIKTYGPSPTYLKGRSNEVHSYRWKFKLDAGFQPSPNFTHIFQIKAGDGTDDGAPIMTLTPRAGSPERLQLIFTPSSGGSGGGTKANPTLSGFKGEWVEAYVRTLYAEAGTFEIEIKRMRDGLVLMSWSSSNIDMWRTNATFNRPKWGIYRSLNSPSYLRDEEVLFADFCIAKGNDICPTDVGFPPAAPTGLGATPGNGRVILSWNPAAGAVTYNVKRSTIGGGPYTTIATGLASTGYTNLSLVNGTTYYYVASAVNAFGESTNSLQVSATPIDPGYQITAAPPSRVIDAGATTNYTVTVITNNTFAGTITLGIFGLPPGASAEFNPPALSASGDSVLTIQTTTNTPGGDYLLTINGVNGTNTASTTVTLTVSGAVANPGPLLWTGLGIGNNWSTIPNWTNTTAGGNGPPGPLNDLTFTNLATAGTAGVVNNTVDASYTVGSMRYSQTAGFHTAQISDGVTLTLSNAVGGNTLLVGTGTDSGADQKVSAAVTGANGALIVRTPGNLNIRQGGAAGTHQATLDLSGLGSVNAVVGRILVAGDGTSAAGDSRLSGVLSLARTNVITALGSAPAINIGDHPSNGRGNPPVTLLPSFLFLGQSNAIFTDSITVGRQKAAAVSMLFNPAFAASSPFALFRGTNGLNSRVGLWAVGDNLPLGSSNQASEGTNNFSLGTVDAMIDLMRLGASCNGNNVGSGTGVVSFASGTIDVNTLQLGYQTANSGAFGVGTVNVNGAAELKVNTALQMARFVGGTGSALGTLNINGGTVIATNIAGLGGSAAINLNYGTLDVRGTNLIAGRLAGITTLNIGGSGSTSPALLANAGEIQTINSIVIASNGVLSGKTVITAPALVVNGAIAPGNETPGAITNNGAMTFGPGGRLIITVQDAAAGPGSGWSYLHTGGGLNVQSSSGVPFVIDVRTLAGQPDNFDFRTNYTWTIATAAGGLASFAVDKFRIEHSLFESDLAGGYFVLRDGGNSLLLSFTNNHPPAAEPLTVYRLGNTVAIPLATLTEKWSDPDGDPVALVSVESSSQHGVDNVSADGAFIYYTNFNQGIDLITYTIGDIRTNPPAVYQGDDTIQTAVGEIVVVPLPELQLVRADAGMVFSGMNGVSGASYYLLASTNLALPLDLWTRVLTNVFDETGAFQFTNSPAPEDPTQRFFRLQIP